MVELETVRVPSFKKAPPLPNVVLAPETLTPEIVRFAPEEILKTLKSRLATPLLPLITRFEEPSPVMVRVPAVAVLSIAGKAELSVMVVPRATEKTISSDSTVRLENTIACLREPGPKSLLFITIKVAGVILSSKVMSSSLEESEDFLAFLFCEILKNLRKT